MKTVRRKRGDPGLDHRRGFSVPHTKRAIAELPWPMIEKMITERRIDTIDVKLDADLPEFIWRSRRTQVVSSLREAVFA